MTELKYGTSLLSHLSLAFGPTGAEEEVAERIKEQLDGTGASISTDRAGNLFAVLKGSGEGYDEGNPTKVLLSAHMDEVGFIIKDIDSEGYIRFGCVGGIDPRVLCGRHVVFRGREGDVYGVIASKAIHNQTAEERRLATKVDAMYIDIGADSGDDAKSCLARGDFGTFESDFVIFGENDSHAKCKALDDRLGCAVIIETFRRIKENGIALPFDLIGAFTVREEIGISGAALAAHRFTPDYAVVLETTAIADLPNVPKASRVANVGEGGVISLLDRSTIYDRELVDAAMDIAAKNGIKAQIKRYVSGGNDANHIHKAAGGCRCLAISAATRYLHSASNVIALSDYVAIKDLLFSILTSYSF